MSDNTAPDIVTEPTTDDEEAPPLTIVPDQEQEIEHSVPPALTIQLGEAVLNYRFLHGRINKLMETAYDEQVPDHIADTAGYLQRAAEGVQGLVSQIVWPLICIIPPEELNINFAIGWSALDSNIRDAAIGGHHHLDVNVSPSAPGIALLNAEFVMESDDDDIILSVPILNIKKAYEHRVGVTDPDEAVEEETTEAEGDLPYE